MRKKLLKRLALEWLEQAERWDSHGDDFHKGIAYGVREVALSIADVRFVSGRAVDEICERAAVRGTRERRFVPDPSAEAVLNPVRAAADEMRRRWVDADAAERRERAQRRDSEADVHNGAAAGFFVSETLLRLAIVEAEKAAGLEREGGGE